MSRMTNKEAEHILINMREYIEYDEDYGCLFKPKLVDASVRAIRALRAEPKEARWEDVTGGMVVLGNCSECKVRQPVIGTNYCKGCGAKMGLEYDIAQMVMLDL